MRKKIFYLFVVSGLFSCEKDANIKLPEVENEPVLVSFLNPGSDKISVKLHWDDPIFSNNSNDREPITDATVTISNGSTQSNLIYNSATTEYELDTSVLSIDPGTTYTISVLTANGKNAFGTTKVPNENISSVNSFSQDTTVTYQDPNQTYFEVNGQIEWNDIPGISNYYSLVLYSILVYPPTGDTTYQYQMEYLMNDFENDGGIIHYPFIYNANDYLNNYVTVGTRVIIANVNYDYYEYHRTVQLGLYPDPFSEPVLIYSNITGGKGVVSGYTQSVFEYLY